MTDTTANATGRDPKAGQKATTARTDTAPSKRVAKAAEEAKAARAAVKPRGPKADPVPSQADKDAAKLAVVKGAEPYGKEGSKRRASWDLVAKSKTVADYVKAGGARKYLGRWQAAKLVTVG